MVAEASTHHTLEDLPYDEEKEKPLRLELSLLKAITNNFSEEQVIGSGAYGVVYKALLGDNFIAVKLLGSLSEIEGKTFEREVDCLVRVKHRNIVGFVGYCAESHVELIRQGAKIFLAESQKRLLCFEYMRNGSLRRHLITGEPCGLQWHVCYQIVKGMCQGLHHLHEKHIIHLDLKPDNILLDDDMVPKITDFGLSRLLGVEKSRTVTQNIRGSMGYMAPEYVSHGSITIKSDIYSLGVIIMQMLTGHKAEPIIENALEIWRCRLESETSQRHTPLEIGYQQVKACIEISTSCTDQKPENRPVTGDIIRRLGETVASGISTSPENNQFRKDVSAQVPHHASHPVHFDFEAQSQNPPFKGLSRSDVLDASFSEAAEDDPLPGVDDHQITGEVFLRRELQANGFHVNPLEIIKKTCEQLDHENIVNSVMEVLLNNKFEDWLSSRCEQNSEGNQLLPKQYHGVIHTVAALGYNCALKSLLRSGVAINYRDANGWTALHWAARFGREEMVVALLAAGAAAGALSDPTSEDPAAKTPASMASLYGFKGLSAFLSEAELVSHLHSLESKENGNLRDHACGEGISSAVDRISDKFTHVHGGTDDQLALKDSLGAIRNAVKAAGRIQAAFRVFSFRKKQEMALQNTDNYILSVRKAGGA